MKCPRCGRELYPGATSCVCGRSARKELEQAESEARDKAVKKKKIPGWLIAVLSLLSALILALVLYLAFTQYGELLSNDARIASVELTLPAKLVDAAGLKTEEELEKHAKASGFLSERLNDDGSLTVRMSKNKYNELVRNAKRGIDEGLKTITDSGSYPGILSIRPNESYTVYRIDYDGDEVNLLDSSVVIALYTYGEMMNWLNGTPERDVRVQFFSHDTGKLLQEGSSKSSALYGQRED